MPQCQSHYFNFAPRKNLFLHILCVCLLKGGASVNFLTRPTSTAFYAYVGSLLASILMPLAHQWSTTLRNGSQPQPKDSWQGGTDLRELRTGLVAAYTCTSQVALFLRLCTNLNFVMFPSIDRGWLPVNLQFDSGGIHYRIARGDDSK